MISSIEGAQCVVSPGLVKSVHHIKHLPSPPPPPPPILLLLLLQILPYVHRDSTDYLGRGAQDVHLDLRTATYL